MSGKKILIVEDNKFVGSVLRYKLQAARYSVVWAIDLAEALVVLESQGDQIFAAILDFALPDAPSGEIIDHVVSRNIPAVVYTGVLSEEIRSTVWMKKVVDYVLKDNSFSHDYLVMAIQRLERNFNTKVLVVDDSSFFLKLIVGLLKVHRFQILTASNGNEALQVVEEHPDIKLVITDFRMPEMDGFNLTQHLRMKYSKEDMSIIGVSGKGENLLAARFIKYGANDFIVKQTLLAEEFYSRVNQCLDSLDNVRKIRESAIKDYLTGLFNRRYFFDVGHKLFASAARKSINLSCAMIDVDHFKEVNDTYGHDVGDKALQHISAVLREYMRETDIVARVGGEEFCILAVNVGEENVEVFFEQLRQRLGEISLEISDARKLNLTVSIGVALNGCAYSLEGMVKVADDQLYDAKRGGRNRVVVSRDKVSADEVMADIH
ncbi:MAG: diguanylate cyclase [Desulfobulbaceae bacterium]|nr:diguanylate cyclase [Desulfobulbaceae bacterium]